MAMSPSNFGMMTNQHWRAARAMRFANTAGATGTAPSPKGVNGPKGPGSLWNTEDLCALIDGLNVLESCSNSRLTQKADQMICLLVGRSPHTYARSSRDGNWGAGRAPHTVWTATMAPIESLAEHPQTGASLFDPQQGVQAVRRLCDKKKLTFMDKSVIHQLRNAIFKHQRYVANPLMEYDD
jgi:hypothetical protein